MKILKYVLLFIFIALPVFFLSWISGFFNITYEVSADIKADYSGVMKAQVFYIIDGINQGFSQQQSIIRNLSLSKDEFSHLSVRFGDADRGLNRFRLDLGDKPSGKVTVRNLQVNGHNVVSLKDESEYYFHDLRILSDPSFGTDEAVFEVTGRDPYISSNGPVLGLADMPSIHSTVCLKVLTALIFSVVLFWVVSYLLVPRLYDSTSFLSGYVQKFSSNDLNASSCCKLKDFLWAISVFAAIFLILFFRNTGIFIRPAPMSEDFAVFLTQEYNIGFPETAFTQYSGYIHLLPRIIAWIAMKFDLSNAMIFMNWSVLFFKVLVFYLIFTSKEISSRLVKLSLLAYLILFPFPDETYNNVTNLQWWLIPLMAIIIIRRDTNVFGIILCVYCLILAGLTGVNSVLFSVPCAYLIFKVKRIDCTIKCLSVIICAAVQFGYLYMSGRSGIGHTFKFDGDLIVNLIHLFVNRAIYHTLFDFYSRNYINFLVFAVYMSVLFFNFYYYRKQTIVRFMFLFWVIYLATILYRMTKTQNINGYVLTSSGERYFIVLCTYSFVILISSLNILFKCIFSKKYKKLMAYSCFLICLVFVKNYPVDLPSSSVTSYQYYKDIERFKSAKTGERVNFHFYFSWTGFCHKSPSPWSCYLIKK